MFNSKSQLINVSQIEMIHRPVMPAEVIEWLAPVAGGVYVDGNLGMGGHTALILAASSPDGRVIGFDWDEAALAMARERLAPFGNRLCCVRRNFAELKKVLSELEIPMVDGLLLDLGLSSYQLEHSGRGFSFKSDEPLDMRMDGRQPESAADLVNRASQEELADIFYYFGEERQARRIAATIVAARKTETISTAGRLAEIVSGAVPKRFHPKKIHPATKVFQGLRIAVNQELDNLAQVLHDAPDVLKPGGRFAAISFHSLEDRLVKRAFRENPSLRPLVSRPLTPGAEELAANPRARSARLRVAEKVS